MAHRKEVVIFPPSPLDGLRPNPDWAKLPIFDRKGWKRVRFGDVVENLNESERDPQGAGVERFIGLEHLEPGSLHIRTWGNVADGTTFTRQCRPGQVLFGKRRAYQRKVAVAEFDAVVSGDIYVLAPKNDRLLPELLPFLCMTDRFFEHAVGTSAGSLSPRTNWTSLASFEFALPPLDQQQRIAEILWAAKQGVSSSVTMAGAAAEFRGSYLRSIFAGAEQTSLVPVYKTGTVQLGRQRAPKYQKGTSMKPYLRVANVFHGFIDYNDVLQMDFDEHDFAVYRLQPGDILLNEGQSRELVGRCAVYDGKIEDCCFQNTLVRYRAGEDVLIEYALAFFQHCFHSGVFAAIASQTTSIAHLGAERFGRLLMPVPPKREQKKIAEEFDQIRLVELSIKSHMDRVLRLRQTLIELCMADTNHNVIEGRP